MGDAVRTVRDRRARGIEHLLSQWREATAAMFSDDGRSEMRGDRLEDVEWNNQLGGRESRCQVLPLARPIHRARFHPPTCTRPDASVTP